MLYIVDTMIRLWFLMTCYQDMSIREHRLSPRIKNQEWLFGNDARVTVNLKEELPRQGERNEQNSPEHRLPLLFLAWAIYYGDEEGREYTGPVEHLFLTWAQIVMQSFAKASQF